MAAGGELAPSLCPTCTVLLVAVFTAAALAASPSNVQAQSAPMVDPSHGQSFQQQAQDEGLCRSWAQQQTGFNPMQGPVYASRGSTAGGQMVRGAAGGAALWAIGGAIGGDAGKGAAIGSGVGAAFGLMRRHRQHRVEEQAQQHAIGQYNQQLANYNRGLATCMQGRGYAVN